MRNLDEPATRPDGAALLWIAGTIARQLGRQRRVRALMALFLLLVSWWALAVPVHRLDVHAGPWMPWGWARWCAGAWLLLEAWRRPGDHEIESGARPALASWYTARVSIEVALVWLLAELVLWVAGAVRPTAFHVEPLASVVNLVAVAALASASLSARILAPVVWLRSVILAGTLIGVELMLHVSTDPLHTALGSALVATSVAVILDFHWRTTCSSRS